MNSDRRLLLFTRYPKAGETKTRLIPAIGAESAAILQKKLTERTMREARSLEKKEAISTTVYYLGGSRRDIFDWLNPRDCTKQAAGDLGEKMRKAFVHTFSSGISAAILIGCDIPDITVTLLRKAFDLLNKNDLVIGPSLDGGYYLIGMKSDAASLLLPRLFTEMTWSSPDVYQNTISRLREYDLKIATLPTLQDIDSPDQLGLAKEKGLL